MLAEFFAISLTLFFIIDALGNIPTYLTILKDLTPKERQLIAIRELLVGLAIMIAFHYVGQILLTLLGVSKTTVQISGGIILFLIAIRLIFSQDEGTPKWEAKRPFIVPIATPMIAGPSVLSIIMIFAQDDPTDILVLSAILAAWACSAVIFLSAVPILRLVKERGLLACQRLMGLIVAIVAVQLFLTGVEGLIK